MPEMGIPKCFRLQSTTGRASSSAGAAQVPAAALLQHYSVLAAPCVSQAAVPGAVAAAAGTPGEAPVPCAPPCVS